MSTRYQPWRPIYELDAAIGWFGSTAWMLYMMSAETVTQLTVLLLAVSLYMMVIRGLEAWDMIRAKYALLGKPLELVTPQYVKAKIKKKPDHLWLGWGHEWGQEEAQTYSNIEDLKLNEAVPKLLRKYHKKGPLDGLGIIHGVSPDEKDIYIPYRTLVGHCFVPATNGALKTRLLALIALQQIMRDPKMSVIVVDPKGDLEMLNLIRWSCKEAGREQDFCYLHPAFPRESVRFDLLKNWTTTTEGASRVAELMGGDEGSAPFKAYGWQVINNIIQGMLGVGERPQLTGLRRYIEGGPDRLLLKLITRYLNKLGYDAEKEINRYLSAAKKVRGRAATTPKEAIAAILLYKEKIQPTKPLGAIDGLLSMYEHDAAHFSKMIATLQPILSMLTSDELKAMLSPDYNDTEDPREIMDNARLLRTGRVFYLGLHSMPDATVSSAIGNLYLADLVAVLGERNVRDETKPEVVLMLDEANEIVNEPLVQILNKGRSAGLTAFIFTQTIQDFISKYGNEAPAMQLLGNANNLIFGRSLEPKTIEYITGKACEVKIESTMQHYSINPVGSNRNLTDYGSSYGTRKEKAREPLIRAEQIQGLPNMEFFGIFKGRKVYKGRAPVVTLEDAA